MTPDKPSEIKINGLPNGAESFTIGGYPDQMSNPLSNKLIGKIGYESNKEGDILYANGTKSIMNKVEIKPPDGQSDSQFINNLGKVYNGIDLTGMNYRFWGNFEGLYDANSNNFAYTIGVKTGVKDQMDSFRPNPQAIVGAMAPGYGKMLPETSVWKQIQQTVDNIKNIINSLSAKANQKQ